MIKVKRALLSVSDKTGIVELAVGLHRLGIEILSTGGTAKLLRDSKIPVMEVSDYTGFPEMMDGRVKTLHPKIHGGLLALREHPEHMAQLKEQGIGLIDMVVVNLYPFERVTQKKNITLEEAIENIDIGGPSMLRSAAKNYKSVAVVSNPARYEEILKELDTNSGILPDRLLTSLALEAFTLTSYYDNVISQFLNNRFRSADLTKFPKDLTLRYTKIQDLRYGENPHQAGAFYAEGSNAGLAGLRQLHGKELSFNNILDLNAAVNFVKDFELPTAVIIKHNNPTGVAQDKELVKAYKTAFKVDALSAFGGIIAFNKKVDAATAKAIVDSGFMECVIAPAFDKQAVVLLSEKKNLRLLELDLHSLKANPYALKQVAGGVLVQDTDQAEIKLDDLKIVTVKKPTKAQLETMMLGWKIVKHVTSNAIVLVKGRQTVGIGGGLTSRVDSAAHAIRKAGASAKGSILASDAFLPKIDTVTIAAKAGVSAIIQTGGSIMDEDVIKEANRCKLAMVFTGVRHFKH
ncbi:MAG: bifunctional phosphoribosylaminoimidazolecarboxamide formyltransferase/IMP cyclohydrolase [Candidatus Omnitrophica bacterium]|nr:bifunctional phosphoribosylaminoimidazolecarboxamide formyltransferase/IMP cyclohydrolase [Candidatus Omnitrophota bacterium]